MSVKVAGVTLKVTGADQFKTDLGQANNALKNTRNNPSYWMHRMVTRIPLIT